MFPCRRCGYSLFASVGEKCPECGVPIVLSSLPQDLSHADPRWLSTVHRGLSLQTVRVFYDTGAIITGIWLASLSRSASVLGFFTLLPSLLLDLWGTWLITHRHPSIESQRCVLSVGRAVRLLSVTKCVIFASRFSFDGGGAPPVPAFAAVIAFAEAARFWYLCEYLRCIGGLGLAPTTLRTCRRARVHFAITLVALGILLCACPYMPGAIGVGLSNLIVPVIVSGWLTSVWCWSTVLVPVSAEFRKARDVARTVWAEGV